MNKENWKSEKAFNLAHALMMGRGQFDQARQGPAWKSMMLSVAYVFKEDKGKVFALLGEKPKEKPQSTVKIVTPPVNKFAINKTDCEDCPDKIKIGPNGPAVVPMKVGKPHPLSKTEAVLERFENDFDMLVAHAQTLGISKGNSSKTETIARKIAAYYADQKNVNASSNNH
ncbi:MAG: hypothetical protein AAFU03_05780 [Bacteroidota bacterium]